MALSLPLWLSRRHLKHFCLSLFLALSAGLSNLPGASAIVDVGGNGSSPEPVTFGIETTLQKHIKYAVLHCVYVCVRLCICVYPPWRVVTLLRGNRRFNIFTIDLNLQVSTVSLYLQFCQFVGKTSETEKANITYLFKTCFSHFAFCSTQSNCNLLAYGLKPTVSWLF